MLIGVVAFITQLQLLRLLRYHKTIAILTATLSRALGELMSFGVFMGVIFLAFSTAIYLLYHDMIAYCTVDTTFGSQV